MVSKPILAAVASGVAAALLFIAFLIAGLGAPFLLMPSFPLFLLGLRHGVFSLLTAIVAGGIIALPLAGGVVALSFEGLVGLPVLVLVAALLKKQYGAWQPVELGLADLTIYAALMIAGLVLHFADQPGGFKQALADTLPQGFNDAAPDVQMAVQVAVKTLPFLIVSISAWWWVLLLYAHAWLANWALNNSKQALRPSLAFGPFHLPASWLIALALAALFSLMGDDSLAFLGQTLFIIFLLPYFLLGITLIHSHMRGWPNRGLLLFVLYLMTLTQFWPALLIAGVGLWRQIRIVRLGE